VGGTLRLPKRDSSIRVPSSTPRRVHPLPARRQPESSAAATTDTFVTLCVARGEETGTEAATGRNALAPQHGIM